jgi:hypothetical protein
VFDGLLGVGTEAPPQAEAAIEMMERLAEVLADESDGSVRAIPRAVARRVDRMPVVVQVEDGQSRKETLAETLCWSLGVDGTFGWHQELPSVESLRHPVENWVGRSGVEVVPKSQAERVVGQAAGCPELSALSLWYCPSQSGLEVDGNSLHVPIAAEDVLTCLSVQAVAGDPMSAVDRIGDLNVIIVRTDADNGHLTERVCQ